MQSQECIGSLFGFFSFMVIDVCISMRKGNICAENIDVRVYVYMNNVSVYVYMQRWESVL